MQSMNDASDFASMNNTLRKKTEFGEHMSVIPPSRGMSADKVNSSANIRVYTGKRNEDFAVALSSKGSILIT